MAAVYDAPSAAPSLAGATVPLRSCLLSALLLLASVAPASAQRRQRPLRMPLPAGWTTSAGQVFATVGGRDLALDIFHPAEPTAVDALPLVVFVHGGGWRGGLRAIAG